MGIRRGFGSAGGPAPLVCSVPPQSRTGRSGELLRGRHRLRALLWGARVAAAHVRVGLGPLLNQLPLVPCAGQRSGTDRSDSARGRLSAEAGIRGLVEAESCLGLNRSRAASDKMAKNKTPIW